VPRELGGLTDLEEAGAVFRLPSETPRRPPLFERVILAGPPPPPPPPRPHHDPHRPTFHRPSDGL
jgi:hypothetical protein